MVEKTWKRELYHYYVTLRWSLRRIAAVCGISHETVRQRLIACEIDRPRRGNAGGRPKLLPHERHEIVTAFEQLTPDQRTAWCRQAATKYGVSQRTINRVAKEKQSNEQ